MRRRFHAGHPLSKKVSEKLHRRGRRRVKKTANHMIVTSRTGNINEEGEADKYECSLCISAQKERHKLNINILRTLKLVDCMEIKYNNIIPNV